VAFYTVVATLSICNGLDPSGNRYDADTIVQQVNNMIMREETNINANSSGEEQAALSLPQYLGRSAGNDRLQSMQISLPHQLREYS